MKKEIHKNNKIIAEFMGYKYFEPNVSIDYSDCGGIYELYEVYSKIPIEVERYENGTYFKDIPNPDYKKTNPAYFRNDLEKLDWSSIYSSEILIGELKYHNEWNWLIPVCKKWYDLYYIINTNNLDEYNNHTLELNDLILFFDIDKVYQQLITCIKWYIENESI